MGELFYKDVQAALKGLQEVIMQEMNVNVRKSKCQENYRESLRIFIGVASIILNNIKQRKYRFKVIGKFVKKDRTTINYHQKTHQNLMEVDADYRQKFTMIKNSFYEN